MLRFAKIRILLLLLVPLFSLTNAEAAGKTGTTGRKAAKSRPSYSNVGIPYKDPPLFLVDGYPLTEEELLRFNQRMIQMSSTERHTKKSPIKDILESFIRYKVVLDEGKRLALDNTAGYRGAVEVYRRAALANDFLASLKAKYAPSEEELKKIVPESWVQYNFKVKAFKTIEEAAEARSRIKTQEDFEKLSAPVALSGYKSTGTTGLIFRKSGFFEEFDEGDLFKLQPGEISRPVPTGIGPALCLVLERKEIPESERNAFIAERKAEYAERYVQFVSKEILQGANYTIDRAVLRGGVVAEGKWGVRIDNVVLILDNTIELTYRQSRILAPANLGPYFRDFPESAWSLPFEGEVENLAKLYVLSKEADKRKIPLDKKWEKELYDFRNSLLYYDTIARLFAQTKAKATEKEARQHYDMNRNKFVRPPYVRVKYIYGPNEEEIKSALAKVPRGQSPFLAEELKDRVKPAIFSRTDRKLGSMFDEVFKLAVGSRTGILTGEAGFYVFLLEEKDEEKKVEFKDVKKSVIDALVAEKRTKAVSERLEALVKNVKVVEM
jgi:parvulin-like peptidyl-prolyl isomerase